MTYRQSCVNIALKIVCKWRCTATPAHLGINGVVVIQIEHFGRSIHGRRLLGNLLLYQVALVDGPTVIWPVDFSGCAAEVAQLDLVASGDKEVLEFEVPVDYVRILVVQILDRAADLVENLEDLVAVEGSATGGVKSRAQMLYEWVLAKFCENQKLLGAGPLVFFARGRDKVNQIRVVDNSLLCS